MNSVLAVNRIKSLAKDMRNAKMFEQEAEFQQDLDKLRRIIQHLAEDASEFRNDSAFFEKELEENKGEVENPVVKAYRERRKKRLDAKDEEGRWITTENNHKVHLNEEGEPDKGNPHVIEKMTEGSNVDISDENAKRVRDNRRSARREMIEAHNKAYGFPIKSDLDYALGWQERMDKWKNTKAELLKQVDEEYYGGDEEKIKQRAKELEDYARNADFKSMNEQMKADREANEEKWKINGLKKIRERLSQLDMLMDREKDPPSEEKIKELQDAFDSAKAEYEECRKNYEKSVEESKAVAAKKFPKLSKCKKPEDVEEYLLGKGYFSGEDENELYQDEIHFGLTKTKEAKMVAERIDKIMEDYPFMVGLTKGLRVNGEPKGYAHANFSKGFVEYNWKWLSDPKKMKESWESERRTHFTADYDYMEITDHEYVHMIEHAINGKLREKGENRRASDIVAEAVCRKLNNGERSDEMEDLMRSKVSGYAYENRGVKHEFGSVVDGENGYGRNTEYLAEAITEARCSKNPSEIARLTQEEFNRLAKEVFG